MQLIVHPSKALTGELSLPGDKSLSHRAALLAALAEGESCIENFQDAGVTRALLNALSGLGVAWTLDGARLQITGSGWQGLRAPAAPLNCGNSATTLRLLAGALAAAGVPAVLDGSSGLRRRPMNRILEPLGQMGVPIESLAGGPAPLRLLARPQSQPLHAIDYSLPVASAQVKSCLLLAGLAAGGPLTLHEPAPSRDHTERMLRTMGRRVESVVESPGQVFTVVLYPSPRPLQPLQMRLPGDISSAAFLIAAALITPGSEITLREIGLNPTRTGILDVFQAMGADLTIQVRGEQAGEPYGDITARSSQLTGVRVAGDLVVRMIDEFPILAVAACFANGTTQVSQASELRHKESDRITTLCQELKRVGASFTEAEDGFSIHGPCSLHSGRLDPHGDHRLALSFAVAGLAADEALTIQKAEIMAESFPGFAGILAGLGAGVEVEADHAR